MRHAEEMATAIARAGHIFVENRRLSGHSFTFAVYRDIEVEAGRFHGAKLSLLAVPIPDDPMLPPPGFHTVPHLGVIGDRNVHASPLGPEWAYWSRPIPGYMPSQGAARILSHLRSVFRDA
jgi:hypothetical protein